MSVLRSEEINYFYIIVSELVKKISVEQLAFTDWSLAVYVTRKGKCFLNWSLVFTDIALSRYYTHGWYNE